MQVPGFGNAEIGKGVNGARIRLITWKRSTYVGSEAHENASIRLSYRQYGVNGSTQACRRKRRRCPLAIAHVVDERYALDQ